MTAAEIEALGGYYGATPRPDDFESFWQARMAEADAVPLHYTVTQAQEVPSWDSCEFLDLWFTGMEGARLYGKAFTPAPERADAAGSAVSRLPRRVPQLCRAGVVRGHGHGADRHGLPRSGRLQ